MSGRIQALSERLRGAKRHKHWTGPVPAPASAHPTPEAERTPRSEAPLAWEDTAAVRLVPGGPVELPDSRAEPGGVPVRVDPEMVNPETAERMRPLIDP